MLSSAKHRIPFSLTWGVWERVYRDARWARWDESRLLRPPLARAERCALILAHATPTFRTINLAHLTRSETLGPLLCQVADEPASGGIVS